MDRYTIRDLEEIYDNDKLQKYHEKESYIENTNWNNSDVELLHIAFYIILNNPKLNYDIEENKLREIRKEVSILKGKILKKRLSSVYDYDVMDEYEQLESSISTQNWNTCDIKLIYIAFYIILNNPKPTCNIEPKKLEQIKQKIKEVELKVLKFMTAKLNYDWFTDNYEDGSTPNAINLKMRLGKYYKYFIRDFTNIEKVSTKTTNDTKKKYLYQEGVYVLNAANGIKDEVQVVKEFLDEIEEDKSSLLSLYKEVRKLNQDNKNPKAKPTDIDNILKKSIKKRLLRIGISESKIKRITPTVIKAIKKEILHL